MKLCYVTDRKALAGSADEQLRAVLEKMANAASAGVDWIQIREKDLSARALTDLVEEAVRRVPRSCRILVNDRLDVAMVAGTGGAHLAEQSVPVDEARRFWRERNPGADFLVGLSKHAVESAQAAQKSGADYVIFGPVYATPTKVAFGPPQGLERLTEVCRNAPIPVVAIGGITVQNAKECVLAGAAGIAAIRLFQEAADISAVVGELRQV